jgi:hypothetical protein
MVFDIPDGNIEPELCHVQMVVVIDIQFKTVVSAHGLEIPGIVLVFGVKCIAGLSKGAIG